MKMTAIILGLTLICAQSFAQMGNGMGKADCQPRMGMQVEVMGKMLDEATSISPEVKEQLRTLHKKHMEQRMSYNEQVRNLRIKLAEKLLDPKASKSDIKKLKKEFKKLEEKRMDASMKNLEEATKLLKPIVPSTDADKKLHSHLFHLLGNDDN